ncbi:MAG: hypothetical protein COA99_07410 [Moraxellaceae bacterium]|nr:MAG: hypothetical protein COA99_07410 [Moraxellaceae bacterium]
MKLIYRNSNRAFIYSAKNVLALSSIECFLKNEHSNTSGGELGIANMFLELWILKDEDFVKASEIIDTQFENPVIKAPWVCAECKEENDGSFEFCWQCQFDPNL